MKKLKDGTTTLDRRLDRLVYFDKRSRKFPIRAITGTRPLRSYTWSCGAVLDQGRDGACVGFGCTHELIARPAAAVGGVDEEGRPYRLDATFAKERVYWPAQRRDPWPGGSYPGARPKYEGTSVLAGVQVLHDLGWFDSYRWAFSLNDVLLGIGYHGPCVFGLAWYEGMFTPDAEGYIHPTGELAGGHCVIGNVVQVRQKRIRIHNSWGPGWGNGGGAWISFEDLRTLMGLDGEACFFVGRHRKPKARP